jgi:integrase/recombinase XerD
LIDHQYVASVVYIKARHALAFDRWLRKRGVVLADLSDVHIERYQHRTRRRHQCIRTATRYREYQALMQLLKFLRCRGECPAARVKTTAADDLVAQYGQHLQDHQGLATVTIERYRTVAKRFLHERFGCGVVDLRALRAGVVIAFVQSQTKFMRPPALKCIVTALRSFLRYAQYRGEMATALAAAVPIAAAWTTTPVVPKAISPEHAQRAIDSCDLSTRVGLRDRALLLLLARLGLRAHEIIALRLEDCDWNSGHLRVRGKSGREQLLPIPADVGAAIAAYLQQGRPTSKDRHLFLRSMAPICGLMPGSDAIGTIVRYALQRAKVDAPRGTGAHVRVIGKGRKEQCTPLSKNTRTVLSAWVKEPNKLPDQPVFPNASGGRLSAHGVHYLLAKHVAAATTADGFVATGRRAVRDSAMAWP